MWILSLALPWWAINNQKYMTSWHVHISYSTNLACRKTWWLRCWFWHLVGRIVSQHSQYCLHSMHSKCGTAQMYVFRSHVIFLHWQHSSSDHPSTSSHANATNDWAICSATFRSLKPGVHWTSHSSSLHTLTWTAYAHCTIATPG